MAPKKSEAGQIDHDDLGGGGGGRSSMQVSQAVCS